MRSSGAVSWERISDLWEQISEAPFINEETGVVEWPGGKEKLSPQRVGQICRRAENYIRLQLIDVAVDMGVISNDDAESFRKEREKHLSRRARATARAGLGKPNRESIQLLFPWAGSESRDYAGAH